MTSAQHPVPAPQGDPYADLPLARTGRPQGAGRPGAPRLRVDHAGERRAEPGILTRALRDPAARVLLVHRGRLATLPGPDGAGSHLALVPAAQVAHLAQLPEGGAPASDAQVVARWLGLGIVRDEPAQGGSAASGTETPVLALVLPDEADAAAPGLEGITPRDAWSAVVQAHDWVPLRDLAASLDGVETALAAPAVALAAWHARTPRCVRCGERTVVTRAGWVRWCEADALEHYPRTDPAVIMAVVDPDDRLLLGHSTAWPPRRFSTLAGYVEPGESIEEAVRREVAEEVGLPVGDVLYRASQPWPFPASLMLGFVARATGVDVRPDGIEVDDARWFTRDELAAAVADGSVLLPQRASIARALVEEWAGTAYDAP